MKEVYIKSVTYNGHYNKDQMNKHGKYGENLYDKYIAATTIIYSIENINYNNG